MKRVWIVLAVAAILIVGGVAIYLMSQQNGTATQTNDSGALQEISDSGTNQNTSDTEQSSGTRIILTNNGFDKASYTVKSGDTVTIKNESSSAMQFSSDDHPTHLKHPELNMDVLLPGESGTFIVETAGTYGFHDHLNDQNTGTLVVE